MNKEPFVIVVILTWNKKEILLECIRSVQALDYSNFKVIVVDNDSKDGTREAVQAFENEIIFLQNDKNLGAIQGKNVGLKKAVELNGDYVFVIDNDLVVEPQALNHMIRLFQSDEKIGLIGAKIYDYVHQDILLSCGSKIDYTQNIVRQYGRGKKDSERFNTIRDVDFLGMGHTMIKREVFHSIGFLDERFLGYGCEDVDFGVQARKSGWRVVYCPDAIVWHRPHSGVGVYSYNKKYLEARNAILFMKKNARFHQWVKYLFFVLLGFPYAMIVEGRRGNWGGVAGKARGLIDGFRGYEAKAWEIMNPAAQKESA